MKNLKIAIWLALLSISLPTAASPAGLYDAALQNCQAQCPWYQSGLLPVQEQQRLAAEHARCRAACPGNARKAVNYFSQQSTAHSLLGEHIKKTSLNAEYLTPSDSNLTKTVQALEARIEKLEAAIQAMMTHNLRRDFPGRDASGHVSRTEFNRVYEERLPKPAVVPQETYERMQRDAYVDYNLSKDRDPQNYMDRHPLSSPRQ